MKTVTYYGPPVEGLSRMTDEEPEPRQAGKIYPVSEEAMANLRRVLASQPPKPQPRGYRKRTNNLVQNLLRRQREKEAERAASKKKRR